MRMCWLLGMLGNGKSTPSICAHRGMQRRQEVLLNVTCKASKVREDEGTAATAAVSCQALLGTLLLSSFE